MEHFDYLHFLQRRQGSERLKSLPKVTQLSGGRGVWCRRAQVCLTSGRLCHTTFHVLIHAKRHAENILS